MNIAELWAEIEAEQDWRQAEIRFLQNQAAGITNVAEQDQFRRALILFLYAHFEGFCKFAFALYIRAINQEGLPCHEANSALAAASLADIFHTLRDPNKKNDLFRASVPDDTQLHRFARDREFIERVQEIVERPVRIPEHVVDTESNLKPIVLRKNLFRLGFPHDLFANIEGQIDCLLNYRNNIAHGSSRSGITQGKYDELKDATYKIINEVKREVMSALQNKAYLRAA